MSADVGGINFEEIEGEIVEKTKDIFELFYPVYWSGLEALKKAIRLLLEENLISENRYVTALLVLVSSSIQHLESMRVLTERGLYGDAFVLSRSLMSNVAMIQYLKYKPELIEDFLKESKEDYQDRKSGFSANFSESAIHKVLTDAGVPPFRNSFEVLSKTAHASAFGSQLYGSRGSKGGQYHLKYGPGYETEKALALFAIIGAGHFDMLDNILMYRTQQEPTKDWKEVLNDTNELEANVNIFSASAVGVMEELQKNRGGGGK